MQSLNVVSYLRFPVILLNAITSIILLLLRGSHIVCLFLTWWPVHESWGQILFFACHKHWWQEEDTTKCVMHRSETCGGMQLDSSSSMDNERKVWFVLCEHVLLACMIGSEVDPKPVDVHHGLLFITPLTPSVKILPSSHLHGIRLGLVFAAPLWLPIMHACMHYCCVSQHSIIYIYVYISDRNLSWEWGQSKLLMNWRMAQQLRQQKETWFGKGKFDHV